MAQSNHHFPDSERFTDQRESGFPSEHFLPPDPPGNDGYKSIRPPTDDQARDTHTLNSVLSERTAQPFSAFKTPFLNTSRWNNVDKLGEVFGFNEYNEMEELDMEILAERGIADMYDTYYDPYPAWKTDDVPISTKRIEAIFIHLCKLFGFQYDNSKNMFDYMMRQLDSRASRMTPQKALRSLHADYVGGVNSNYRRWYFGSQMDISDIQQQQPGYVPILEESQSNWQASMAAFMPEDYVVQLAIFLMVWGEANNVRFMPECLCFIFKTCVDVFYSLELKEIEPLIPSFLDHAITPLYQFYRDQLYEEIDGKWIQRDKDHAHVIGYDDINQFFWYRKSLEKLKLYNKQQFMAIPPHERFLYLNEINWKGSIRKTYYERRSWFHMLTNFNRIWNIHVALFWYYTSFNSGPLYTESYDIVANNQPTIIGTLSALSLAGSLVSLINLVSLICECFFVPRRWAGSQSIFPRFMITLLMLIVNVLPSIYIFGIVGTQDPFPLTLAIAIIQFIFSVITVIICSVVPLSSLAGNRRLESNRLFLSSKYFTDSIIPLSGTNLYASYGLWIGVFICKFTESYFFLIRGIRGPIRELYAMKINRCIGEVYFGQLLCKQQANVILALLIISDLVLFFLDTYLWYIIWNTSFSVFRSFWIGVSIWTPWRNQFVRLPKRILQRILSPQSLIASSASKRKFLVCQIWNSIVISMYRDHLLSVEHLQSLVYSRTLDARGEPIYTQPRFFVDKEDGVFIGSSEADSLESSSEATRRLAFFAQSLSTPMPKPVPVEQMPTFSVLIPHYSEKITLTLQEIIKKEDQYSNITLLEYLKHLYPLEWHNFVRDTKLLAEERNPENNVDKEKSSISDLPFYSVGFKVATPEYILRTRIWASLRSQTLYRTISGFMNYSRAIKLMYTTETEEEDEESKLEQASVMVQRKFRLVASLQRMKDFTPEQDQSREFLIRTYPELQVCYIDTEVNPDTNEIVYYSVLIDGACDIQADGQRKPKYKIRLSGNPIMGDGKSDNQNHAIIFCRGEYIQLIDANQDHYLEECLKIRSVLAEFEEMAPREDPYKEHSTNHSHQHPTNRKSHETPEFHPVAIVGAREYIFSENIGVLGDIAAGKEQTFGTLFARTLAQVGGKLHYGHPDFLNTIFMNTRGGVSKSQKGLHLNEDIYAGMNALCRGGRIKHCEYIQCGKGRDLGFGSILNFTSKIGAGMGEQMLSREYFYLGTQLPLDRFLSFFYAHPGFHLNNVFILASLKMFMLFSINLAALVNDSIICQYNKHVPFTDTRVPVGCYNLIPVVNWIHGCVLSIFVVFAISFIPLCVQELTERGVWKCITRLSKHFISFSPLFEVFVCRIYAQSLVNDLSVGDAKYVATGRGFSTTRTSFSILYARFSVECFYFASGMFMMLLNCSLIIWKFSFLYFWMTFYALLFSPFLFNPNQFQFNEFFIDYKNLLSWLTSGNAYSKKDSWVTHVRHVRMQLTGSKKKRLGLPGDNLASNYKRPSMLAALCTQIGSSLFACSVVIIAYLFANSQNESGINTPSNTILRLAVVTVVPIAANAVILVAFFIISSFVGPVMTCCCGRFPDFIANCAHILAVLVHIVTFEFLMLFQNWNLSKTLLGACASFSLQHIIFKILTIVFLSREFKQDKSNRSWWSGKWLTAKFGWHVFTQPGREFICKLIEMSNFACDFMISHFILLCQFPVLFIPYVDTLHSYLLMWLSPGNTVRRPVFSPSKRRARNRITLLFLFIYIFINICLIGIIVAPIVMVKMFNFDFDPLLPDFMAVLLQPADLIDGRKGIKNYIPPKFA